MRGCVVQVGVKCKGTFSASSCLSNMRHTNVSFL